MGKQDIRSVALGAACLLLAANAVAFTPPRDGGPLPRAYYDAKAKDRTAFTAPHAWVQKAERLRSERAAYLAGAGDMQRFGAESFAVADTFRAVVFPAYYSNQASPPTPYTTLQTQLFGANATEHERGVEGNPAILNPDFVPHVVGETFLRRVKDEAKSSAGRNFLGAAQRRQQHGVLGAVTFQRAGHFGGSRKGSGEVFVVDGGTNEFFQFAGNLPGVTLVGNDAGRHLLDQGIVGLDEVARGEVAIGG